jgi:hypothetical protein
MKERKNVEAWYFVALGSVPIERDLDSVLKENEVHAHSTSLTLDDIKPLFFQ